VLANLARWRTVGSNEHGILFGRGDDLEVGVEAPPADLPLTDIRLRSIRIRISV
jgi:hypothetical protein